MLSTIENVFNAIIGQFNKKPKIPSLKLFEILDYAKLFDCITHEEEPEYLKHVMYKLCETELIFNGEINLEYIKYLIDTYPDVFTPDVIDICVEKVNDYRILNGFLNIYAPNAYHYQKTTELLCSLKNNAK